MQEQDSTPEISESPAGSPDSAAHAGSPYDNTPRTAASPRRRTNPTSTAAREYYDELRDELRGMGVDNVPRREAVDWSDVYQLERRLLEMADSLRLARRAWILRNRYREIAGEPKYALYMASNPPALDNKAGGASDDAAIALRADLLELHHQIVREAIFANAMEQQRAMLSRRMAWITFGILACLFLLLLSPSLEPWAQYSIIGALILTLLAWIGWGGSVLWRQSKLVVMLVIALAGANGLHAQVTPSRTSTATTNTQDKTPLQPLTTLTMAAIAGFLGGTLSVVRRLQTPAVDGDAIRNLQKLVAAESYIVLSPISGVIAALVLYSFFCGGLLKGSLFPTIVCELHVASPTSFMDFLTRSGPETCADQGKVIVWCFIAGFAERLVPDAIDRMTQVSAKQ